MATKLPMHRMYAIGDIHGHLEALRTLFELIRDDLKKFPKSTTADIILLADYVDRGPHSKGVIDFLHGISKKNSSSINLVLLKGNHDVLLESFINANDQRTRFKYFANMLINGGAQTLASYGVFVESAKCPDRKNQVIDDSLPWIVGSDHAEKAHRELMSVIPSSHIEFLSNLKSSFQKSGYFFCHGGVDATKPLEEQDEKVIYGTDYKERLSRKFAKYSSGLIDGHVIVHGHSVVGKLPSVNVKGGRISLDTGCYEGNYISALAFENGKPAKVFQVRSLYNPYDDKHVPSRDTWPPAKRDEINSSSFSSNSILAYDI